MEPDLHLAFDGLPAVDNDEQDAVNNDEQDDVDNTMGDNTMRKESQ